MPHSSSFTPKFPSTIDKLHGSSVTGITCIRDDGSYILEWIAHHLPRGIDHFVVMTHDCEDGTPQLLEALQDLGIVTHLPFTRKGKATAQWQAFKLAWAHPRVQTSDWALFFDCDEFLWLDPVFPCVQDFLDQLEGADAIALPWLLFGSDGQQTRGGDITPQRFQKSAPADLHFPMGHLFKTLFRPTQFTKPGVHRPKTGPAAHAPVWVGPDGTPLPPAIGARGGAISLYGQPSGRHQIGLNHYSLRSKKEFAVKAIRGLPNHMTKTVGVDYWVERNWNTQVNTRIIPMLEQTNTVMEDLLRRDAVRTAHYACMGHYNRRADALDTDVEKLRLIWQLGLISENRLPTAEDVQKYIYLQHVARRTKNDE